MHHDVVELHSSNGFALQRTSFIGVYGGGLNALESRWWGTEGGRVLGWDGPTVHGPIGRGMLIKWSFRQLRCESPGGHAV